MSRSLMALGALTLLATSAFPQFPNRRPTVRASGEGVVSFRPDQVKVSAGVTTQAATAVEAGDANATQTNAVMAALRQLLGANADIRTTGYSLSPFYRTGTSQIAGYSVTNTVEITLNEINNAGRVIDTAAQAGATQIYSLRFTLRDPNPARREALRSATMQARLHAEAIATGLGLHLGIITYAEEGGSVRITPYVDSRAAGAATTPIEPGAVEVRAVVTIEAELAQ
ncbi:MAG: SIMPL domain-containing protein [Acidobacteria bacterium]|nr:SIMPL domain-containing protein [Acidobacteriota bacterium]